MVERNVRAWRRAALGLGAALLLVALGPASAGPTSGGDFAIDWYTIDGGGGTSTVDDTTVSGTIGQPDAGVMD